MKKTIILIILVLLLCACNQKYNKEELLLKPYIPSEFFILENNKLEEGFVIRDKDGNEYVWIPVDEKTVKISRGYIKNDSFITVEKKQSINRIYYGEEVKESIIYNDDKLNINTFIKSVKENGGFYVSRYEIGDKSTHNPRTSEGQGEIVSKKGYYPYTFINRDEALKISKKMYEDNDDITSSLINSYAWDIMMNYLYTYHQNSMLEKNDNSKVLFKNGESGDVISNIYDLRGNVSEWTTEYSSNGYYGYYSPCVYRGESFNSNILSAHTRYYNSNVANEFIGFRIILYR